EDFNNLEDGPITGSGKITFVYAGTLYINLQYIIKPLFKAIGEIKKREPELYNKIEFQFIGKFPPEYKNFIQENNIQEAIKVLDFLPLKMVFQKIKRSDYCLLILNDVYNFNLSTKFYEYISQKKKVVVVAKKGSASEFIVKNKLGYWFDPVNCYDDLVTLLKSNLNNTSLKWDSNYDIEQFSLNSLTNKLAHVIEEKTTPIEFLNKKNILLTFDYELFLGKKSGSVYNCMLKPTEYLLNVFKKYNFKNAIFFVDTTYIKKLTESDAAECKMDLTKIKEQLIDVIRNGHFVFPHLHPHWRDAVYDKDLNQWRLEKTDAYRFHVIPEEERDGLFAFSIRFIKELMQSAGTSYDIDSFRAGGWCLQPFAAFKPYFEKYGIKNDFSVLHGFSLPGKNIFYDYSNIPLRNIYKFSDMVEKEEKDGAFNEIVISTLSISNVNRFLNKFLYKYLWYIKKTSFGDGYSAVDGEASVIRSIQNMEESTKNKSEMVSIELLTFFTHSQYKKLIHDNDFMQFISHPKMFNQHNLNTLDSFLKHITAQYEINSDYKKIIN
ncbi:MAG TPA: hypothetical protein VN026_04555, partial [Bacteroidia bacterium]|nr:hypothetical protein [Bacteroidia bacterium]